MVIFFLFKLQSLTVQFTGMAKQKNIFKLQLKTLMCHAYFAPLTSNIFSPDIVNYFCNVKYF